jgi:hypothetical protein
MLTQEQLAIFNAQGFVRLTGAFTASEAKAMEDRLWQALANKHGVCRADTSTWQVPAGMGLQSLRASRVFDPILGGALRAALEHLLGAGCWQPPRHGASFLVAFPQRPGIRSRANFHTDFPYALPATRLCGALVFAFIGSVPPATGGTLVLAGSHQLIARFLETRPHLKRLKMKVTRTALLDSDPYLRSLRGSWTDEDWVAALPFEEADVSGLPVRMVELTGQPGDVIIGHPWLLHSGAPNRGKQPRFMAVLRIGRSPC